MTTYPYNEAPAFQKDDSAAGLAHYSLARSVASFDTAEEFGYDREVLQEAYECQHIEPTRSLSVQGTVEL